MFGEGMILADEGLRIAEEVNHLGSLIGAYYEIGLLHLRQGHLPKALLWLERALSLCRDTNLSTWFPRVAPALGAAYSLGGRASDAVLLLTEALEWITATDMVAYQALCSLPLGEAHLLGGRLEEAHTLAERTLALTREHQERSHEAYALRLLGDIAAQHEPPAADQTETYYRQALALADELGMQPLQAHCHRGLGMLYSQAGRQAQARTELLAAITLYRTMEMTCWLPDTEASLAHIQDDAARS